MSDTFIENATGEDALTKETSKSMAYGNYMVYLDLSESGYTDEQIIEHLSITRAKFEAMIDMFDPGEE